MCYRPLGHSFAAFFAPTVLVVGERGSPGVTTGNIRTISTSTSRLALGEKPTTGGVLQALVTTHRGPSHGEALLVVPAYWSDLQIASMSGHAECVRVLLSAGAGSGINDRNPINRTALDCAIRYGPRNGRRRVFPLLLAAGATIPSDTTNAYLRKVAAAGGFPAYEKARRQELATKFAAKAFPRLPTEVASQVVAFAFHVGYY